MAFWKKSEDPWDMDPAKQRRSVPVEEETEAAESPLDTLKGWAARRKAAEAEKLTLPPEKCPWCGGEMEQGFLSGGRGVVWSRGVPDTKTKWLGAGHGNTLRVDDEGVLFTYKTAWLCPACEKMTVDAAGLRAPGEDTYNSSFDGSPYSGAFGETEENQE